MIENHATTTQSRRYFIIIACGVLGVSAVYAHYYWWVPRLECFRRLCSIDHIVNCPYLVPLEDLKVGDPIPKYKLDLIATQRRCPQGGEYTLPTYVGERPVCSIHGDMVIETGYQHHPSEYNTMERSKRNLMRLYYGLTLVAQIILAVQLFRLWRVKRKRQK